MKKFLLCVVFGFLMIACATGVAKSDEKVASKQIDDKQNTAFSKVFEQCVKKHTSDDCDDCLFVEYSCLAETLYNNCTQNKDKASCEEVIKVLPSVEECGKEECNDIGIIYRYAEKIEQAVNYYEKACNNFKSGIACANLGDLYALGEVIEQDFFKAVKFYQKSCDLGDQMGCDCYKALNEKGVK